jgi:hypothetical protein
MHWFLLHMPERIRNWFGYYWPEWLLPSTVILKKLKTDWDKEFEREMRLEREKEFERERDTYKKLKLLQGQDIPMLYGEIKCDRNPALLLSDVGGTALCDLDPSEVSPERLRRMLEGPIRNMLILGVEHDDLKLDNFHYIKGTLERVVILDFGDVDPRRSDDIEGICKELVDVLVRRYIRTSAGKVK